ncbi:MAG TPA: gliding motility-associated ABC transporter permease subunit GldF [Cyclobacteriaceae bacterium]|nr:gliding motility-associated ABC transporter permease subunit GldF [Cyclobacteriaceae bacterium]
MMGQLFLKEVNTFFNQLTGYLLLTAFLVALGLVVWVFPETSVLEYGFADLEALFVYTPFIFVFLVPAITMRMIAEERKTGTWELLLTSPLTNGQIILAKYLAALVLIFLALLPTLIYYYSIVQLGDPVGNIDSAGFFGSFIGLILIGAVFAAIGLFSSSLTDNQITAFVIGVFLGFLLYFGLSALASLQRNDWALFIEEFSLSYHFQSMGRGVIDSSNLVYFLSLISTLLVATGIMIRRK